MKATDKSASEIKQAFQEYRNQLECIEIKVDDIVHSVSQNSPIITDLQDHLMLKLMTLKISPGAIIFLSEAFQKR